MKFQHGILDGEQEQKPKADERPAIGGDVEKNRLFETLEEEETSGRSYIKLLSIVVLLVVVGVAAFFYLTLPSYGDRVRAPKGMEMAIRDHLLGQQRTATDVEVYYCNHFYWARAGVESRNDIPGNPLASVKTYTARISSAGNDAWNVDARPMVSPEQDKPCGPLP